MKIGFMQGHSQDIFICEAINFGPLILVQQPFHFLLYILKLHTFVRSVSAYAVF